MVGNGPDSQANKENCPKDRSPSSCSTKDTISPRGFSTPLRLLNDCRQASNSFAFRFLPNFSNSPSRVKEFVAKNPFESDLRNKLHLPVFSPSALLRSPPKVQESADTFSWTIEDISQIQPASIEEENHQVDELFSPKTESQVQEAIESFFYTTQTLQSPWEAQRSDIADVSMSTSYVMRNSQEEDDEEESLPEVEHRDGATQTVLTFPPTLPADLEAALSKYYTFNEDQQQGRVCDVVLSPALPNSPVVRGSPVTSGLMHVSTYNLPIQRSMTRSYNTPGITRSLHLTPSISPISTPRKSLVPVRNRSVISRLDFSDDGMAVDRSLSRHAMSLTEVGPTDNDKENELNFSTFRHHDTGYLTMSDSNPTSRRSDENTLWRPHSAHLVSSTPSKELS